MTRWQAEVGEMQSGYSGSFILSARQVIGSGAMTVIVVADDLERRDVGVVLADAVTGRLAMTS